MRSEIFSGFDVLTAGEACKTHALDAILSGRAGAQARRRRARRILLSSAAGAAAALAIWAGVRQVPLVSKPDYTITAAAPFALPNLTAAPFNLPGLGGGSSASLAVAPSEQKLFQSSDTIVRAHVTGFKWVRPRRQTNSVPPAFTIVTVRVEKSYRGALQAGQTTDVLLPYLVTGTPGNGGFHEEDIENPAALRQGGDAFFFIEKYTAGDTVQLFGTNVHVPATQLAPYGAAWGDEYVAPAQGGGYLYLFDASGQIDRNGTRSLEEVEAAIQRNLGQQ